MLLVCLLTAAFFFSFNWAVAQEPTSPTDTQIEMQIGFEGTAKLGVWQPFFIRTPDTLEPHTFQMTVLDGDDVPVTYAGRLHGIGMGLNQHQGWVKLGRGYGGARLQLLDVHGLQIADQKFPLPQAINSASPRMLPATRRMVLTLESDNRIAAAIESQSMAGSDDASSAITIRDVARLPLDWFCYEGVDTIFLTTGNDSLLRRINAHQWRAIERWIENGGRLVFSSATSAAEWMSEGKPLARFLPGKWVDQQSITASGRLESFAKASANTGALLTKESKPLAISRLAEIDAVKQVEQDGQPLVLRQSRGLGEIVFVAFDLEEPQIAAWSGFNALIQALDSDLNVRESAQGQTADSRRGSVSHFGYEDLIGQLRAPLDQFSSVGFISFTWIALLMGLAILCVGPGDYFLLRRLRGRMEWTWITFPLIVIAFCGLAVWLSSTTRPDDILVNQLEIIDLDASSGHVRGTMWSNLYSPTMRESTISIAAEPNGIGLTPTSTLLSWQGLPGSGLGGMQTKNSPPIGSLKYEQTLNGSSKTDDTQFQSQLVDVPLYVSSSKALLARWEADFSNPIRSRLILSRRSARLEGTVTNPFPVPLKNVRLLFENYAYVLRKSEWEPGETIDVLSEMKERTVRSLLTRETRSAEDESKSQNSPWDATDKRVSRIADLLMFYQSAGGKGYAGLTHHYQGFIDLSDQLYLQRAVLVAEIDQSGAGRKTDSQQPLGTELLVDGRPIGDRYDQTVTAIRILFPVEYEPK